MSCFDKQSAASAADLLGKHLIASLLKSLRVALLQQSAHMCKEAGPTILPDFQQSSADKTSLGNHELDTCRILTLAAWFGIPMAISLSNLPARLNAVSKESGRLVAPERFLIKSSSPML